MAVFLMTAVPGALTFVLVRRLTGRPRVAWAELLIEYIFYCGMDLGIVWLWEYLRARAASAAGKLSPADFSLPDFTLALFGEIMLTALAAGFVFAICRTIQIELAVTPTGRTFPLRLSGGAKKVISAVLAIALLALALGLILRPALLAERQRAAEENKRGMVMELMDRTRRETQRLISDGTAPEDMGDLMIDGISVRRVAADQYWSAGTGRDETEAVYMIDSDGVLVYFSFRDKDHAATWSGPSEDSSFIESKGGWNRGKGFGWTGALMTSAKTQ